MEELKRFVGKWTKKEEIDFPFENVVIIGREYFLTNQNSKKIMSEIKLDANSCGIYLGQMKKMFEPSIALIQLLKNITENKIIVDDKSAWLFACGRDIFEEKVIEKKGFTNNLVLVQNKNEEVFGYAIKKRDGKNFNYKNILDIGNYLRREMR
jgi:ribosome biogenesis protein Nip4